MNRIYKCKNWNLQKPAHYWYYKYIGTLSIITSLYLISCLVLKSDRVIRTILILTKMVLHIVLLILRREYIWMLFLLLTHIQSHSLHLRDAHLDQDGCTKHNLAPVGKICFECFFLYSLIACIQTLFSSPVISPRSIFSYLSVFDDFVVSWHTGGEYQNRS